MALRPLVRELPRWVPFSAGPSKLRKIFIERIESFIIERTDFPPMGSGRKKLRRAVSQQVREGEESTSVVRTGVTNEAQGVARDGAACHGDGRVVRQDFTNTDRIVMCIRCMKR